MQELHHECGIAAIYHLESDNPSPLAKDGPEQVARQMVRMLIDLQNRGQLAAGMTTFNPHRERVLDTYKQIGTVIEAFRLNHPAKFENILRDYAGRAAIGHVRYATCGKNDRGDAFADRASADARDPPGRNHSIVTVAMPNPGEHGIPCKRCATGIEWCPHVCSTGIMLGWRR